MSTPTERLTQRLVQATQRLAQLKARQLLREQREALRAKEIERRALARRRFDLGEAVMSAGFADWSVSEVLGILLEVHERVGRAPSLRMVARKRGERYLGTAVAPPAGPTRRIPNGTEAATDDGPAALRLTVDAPS